MSLKKMPFHQSYESYHLKRAPSLCTLMRCSQVMYFTLFHSNVSHSPLDPIAQLDDSYHLNLGFHDLEKWWVLDILYNAFLKLTENNPAFGKIWYLKGITKVKLVMNDSCEYLSLSAFQNKYNHCPTSPTFKLLWNNLGNQLTSQDKGKVHS